MAEYAGYVAAPNQFDWGKFSSDLASSKVAIAEKVRAEREKKKAAFDKSTLDIYADIKEPEKGYNQDDNDFFTKSVFAGKDAVNEVAKEADYNFTNTGALTRKQTEIAGWFKGLGETAKTIKTNQEKLIDPKFQEGQSDIGRNFSKMYILTSNTKNKKSFFPKDGSPYIQEVDAEGKPTSDVKINPTLFRSTQGWSDGTIDYDKQLNDFTGNQIGEYQKATMLGSGAIRTRQSILDNPLFVDASAKLVTSLTANDNESARFLTSTSGYASYVESDLQQKEKLLSQGIPEEKLIPIGLGQDGIPTAKLTPTQRKAAVDEANLKIKQRVEVTETLTKPASTGGADGGKKTEPYKQRQALMDEVIGLVQDTAADPTGTVALDKIRGIFGDLSVTVEALTDKNDKTKITGYDVFKLDKDGNKIILSKSERRAPSGAYRRVSAGPQGVYELFVKEQKRGSELGNWQQALAEYKERGGDMSRVAAGITRSDTKQPTTPKETVYLDMSVARKNNKGKSDAQIKAAFMAQNKGKKIVWQ
jgi:hypothetical protein